MFFLIQLLISSSLIFTIKCIDFNHTIDTNIRKVLNLTTNAPIEITTNPTLIAPTAEKPNDNNFLHHNTPLIYRSRFIDQIRNNINLKIQNETHEIIAKNFTTDAFLQPKLKNFSTVYNERKKQREYNHYLSKATHIQLPIRDESKLFDDDGLDENTVSNQRTYYSIDISNKTYSPPNIVPFTVSNFSRDSTYNDTITAIFKTLKHFYINDTQEKEINTTAEIKEYIFKKLKPKSSEIANIALKFKKLDPSVAEVFDKEQIEYLEKQLLDFPYMVAYYEDILKELKQNKPEPKVAPLVKDYTPPRVSVNYTDLFRKNSNSGAINKCDFICFGVLAIIWKF